METTLTAKLDKIDEDIRGNGKDGMNVRLDRLENTQKVGEHLVLDPCQRGRSRSSRYLPFVDGQGIRLIG